MRRWWQPSLVRRVVFALLAAFLLVWCALVAVDFLACRRGVEHRDVLEQLTRTVAESLPADDAGQAIAVVKAAELQYNRLRQGSTSLEVGKLLFRLARQDGVPLYASVAAGEGIPETTPGPVRVAVAGRDYWSAVQLAGNWRLQLLEPVIDDTLIVRLLGGDLLQPLLIAFPLVLLPLWLAVRRGLQPLRRMVGVIEARDPGDFRPLSLSLKYAELQPLLEAFNHLLATARQGIERERAFVQDAAHELRTPLAVVGAQAHVLANARDPEQQAQARQALERAVQRASHLVHQLLTLAALEGAGAGGVQRIDLVEISRDVLIAAAPAAAAKGIEIALDSPDQLNVTLDKSLFHSILGNLLDNALAYCPAGSLVSIGLSIEAGPEQDGIRLVVSDNGPGVPADELPRLCERFYRGSTASVSGSGLGLPIVQEAVSRLDGELSLSRGPDGRGLVVTVWVPVG
jgi:two-component system, OmpR family, sensor histidine kinase QseC